MMKRIRILLAILMLVVLLTACGSTTSAQTSRPSPTPTATPLPSLEIYQRDTWTVPVTPSGNAKVYKDGLESDGKIHVYLVGNGETVKAKNSSSIRSLTYYAESDHLIINFNGKEYVFANVSSSLWESFKKASSSDDFYNSHFKGNKSYWVNDYNGKNSEKIVMEYVSSTSQSYSSSDYSYSDSSNEDRYSEYAECENCGRIYEKGEMWNMGGYYVCEDCAENGDYIIDEDSGELYYVDDYWDMMHKREFGY